MGDWKTKIVSKFKRLVDGKKNRSSAPLPQTAEETKVDENACPPASAFESLSIGQKEVLEEKEKINSSPTSVHEDLAEEAKPVVPQSPPPENDLSSAAVPQASDFCVKENNEATAAVSDALLPEDLQVAVPPHP